MHSTRRGFLIQAKGLFLGGNLQGLAHFDIICTFEDIFVGFEDGFKFRCVAVDLLSDYGKGVPGFDGIGLNSSGFFGVKAESFTLGIQGSICFLRHFFSFGEGVSEGDYNNWVRVGQLNWIRMVLRREHPERFRASGCSPPAPLKIQLVVSSNQYSSISAYQSSRNSSKYVK